MEQQPRFPTPAEQQRHEVERAKVKLQTEIDELRKDLETMFLGGSRRVDGTYRLPLFRGVDLDALYAVGQDLAASGWTVALKEATYPYTSELVISPATPV